jgi:hypothetical protein
MTMGLLLSLGELTVMTLATLGAAQTAGRFRVVASLSRDFLGPVATVLSLEFLLLVAA